MVAVAVQAEPWIYWLREGELGRLAIDGSENQVLLTGPSVPTDLAVDLEEGAVYWADLDTGWVVRTELPASEAATRSEPGASTRLAGGFRAPSSVRLHGPWVYFTAAGGIYRVGRDGAGPEQLVETEAADLAISGDSLLWARRRDRNLWRADLDGSGARPAFELPSEPAREIAVAGEALYFVDDGMRTLWRAGLDGSGAEAIVSLGEKERFVELAPSADTLYWTQTRPGGPAVVRRADLDGGGARDVTLPRLQRPSFALAVVEGKIYWGDSSYGLLLRADLDGENLETLASGQVRKPRDLVVHEGWVYWTESARGILSGAVRRCRVDGSDVDLFRAAPKGRSASLVAAHDGTIYWLETAVGATAPPRIVRARPGTLGAQETVYDGELGRIADLFFRQGRLHWLTYGGAVWRLGEKGEPPQKVEGLPSHFRRTRFGDPAEPLQYLAMAPGGETFVAEGRRDAVFEVQANGRLRLLGEDLYVADVDQHDGELYWGGVEGIGRLAHGGEPAPHPLDDLDRIKAIAVADVTDPEPKNKELRGRAWAADGGQVAFTSYGEGEIALVFVHCGFCDQEVWLEQIGPMVEFGFRVVTVDLGGHGESGRTRTLWTLDAFANDVRAVTEKLGLDRFVLVGNSLGAPVSLALAARVPDQVLGVVAVDSLHDATVRWTDEQLQALIDGLRDDYDGACQAMVDSSFHPDAEPGLKRFLHGKMCSAGPELAAKVLGVFFGYEMDTAIAAAGVPILAINGDLQPTNIEANRRFARRFDARVLEGVGHYPQLEKPNIFNLLLFAFANGLEALEALEASRRPSE